MSKTPHKHAELIKAWADGAEIQFRYNVAFTWTDVKGVCGWDEECEFRIKPEPKPDRLFHTYIGWNEGWQWVDTTSTKKPNLKLVFDGETGKLKAAEVL